MTTIKLTKDQLAELRRLAGGRQSSYGMWIKDDRWKKLDVQPPAGVNDFDVVEGYGRHDIPRDGFVVLTADGRVFVDVGRQGRVRLLKHAPPLVAARWPKTAGARP